MSDPVRVLVVDDELAIARMLETAAGLAGWVATTAHNAVAAAEIIDRESFDIYIIDKNLPDGNGVDLVHKVRDKSETAVCVMITAYASAESAKETLRLGIDAYIEKPFDDISTVLDQLKDLVKAANLRSAAAEPRTADQPLKVLVATPDDPARAWLEKRFGDYGDDLRCLDSSKDVVEIVRDSMPDLVVLDAALTDPDVPALMSRIDARAIVILTRSAPATREIIQYISLNVKAVLERPLDADRFADEMDGLLWRLRTRRQ